MVHASSSATRAELSLRGSVSDVARTMIALQRHGFATASCAARGAQIDARSWLSNTPTLDFDRLVHAQEDRACGGCFTIEVSGDGSELARAALQVAMRYQRLWPHRNVHSSGGTFTAVLHAHRACHDLTLPLVRADYEHALDVWQWVLRLAPEASTALQVAALFHDIERLESEAKQRIEQHAPNYLAFKVAHARRGAHLVRALLADVVSDELACDAAKLVAAHEQPGDDPALRVLNDADALSFFALNSAGYLAYYGEQQTEKKVRYTLARISSAEARAQLDRVRLEPFVRAAIARERAALPPRA